MTVYADNQCRLVTWDHDLVGVGSLTDEHRKTTTHEGSDWIYARYQKDPQNRTVW